MFSIDVDYLFKDVPLHEAVDDLCDFFPSSNISLSTSVGCLREIIVISFTQYLVGFRRHRIQTYRWYGIRQPIRPNNSRFVILSTIETKLNVCISKLVLYKQYVDDIPIFTGSTNFVNILKLCNSAHTNISVAYETHEPIEWDMDWPVLAFRTFYTKVQSQQKPECDPT